jgi:hypothetical protein
VRVLPSLLLDCAGDQPAASISQRCIVFLSPSTWQPESFILAASARSPALVRVIDQLVTSTANATVELVASGCGRHAVTVQLRNAAGAVLLQFIHDFVVFPTFRASNLLQPLLVDTKGSKVAILFDEPVLLAMNMRAEVFCSGGGTTATDSQVPFMASSVDITVPWRPFKDSNNSCVVRVRAIAQQYVSSLVLSFSAAMTDALAAVHGQLYFTVAQPGSFPVYFPSSFNRAESASCSGDSTASVVCRTHGLDAAASARFANVTVTCMAVGTALVKVSLLLASASYEVLCLQPLVVDRYAVHVRVGHVVSLRASMISPCTLGVECPEKWSCSIQDDTISFVPPLSADAVTVIVLMSLGPTSCMNNATVTIHAHPLAVFAQSLLLLPPSPDERGGLVASGHLFGPISSDSRAPLLYSSAPRLMTFCNLSIDINRMAFTVTFIRSDVSQSALPCAQPQPDRLLSTSGCPAASSSCASISMVFPCDECVFAPGLFAPSPSASTLQLTQAVALVAGNDMFVGTVTQLPRQSSVVLPLSLVLAATDPVAVSFAAGSCATIVPTAAVFSGVRTVVEMQVTWASSGICRITASSPTFPPLNFAIINAVPPVVMTPQIVRANVWQRTVIITLSVPADLLMNHAVVQLAVSSQNETVGSLPSHSALVDVHCSCLRVPLTIRFPGITRIRSIFVEGPRDLAGVQQVEPRFRSNFCLVISSSRF